MVLLAGLVLVLGPGRDFACLASDEAGTPVVQSPSALEVLFVPAQAADWKVSPDVAHTQYGYSVASAGNVDGDPGDDVLVGAIKDETIDGGGAAYLYRSTGSALNPTHAWAAGGGSHAVSFGSAVAGAGDVNNDGFDDAVIADVDHQAYLEIKTDKWQWVQAGAAFVYRGVDGVGLSLEPTWSYTGTVKEGKFASAVAGAGDLNGDHIDDVVVGAQWFTDQPEDDPNKHSGAIYVFYGHEGTGPSAEPDWFIFSTQASAWFGASVSAAGDVDGDGCDDLIVGAPGYMNPATGQQEGAVLLFLGVDTLGGETPPDDETDAAWIAYGGQEFSKFGTVVASAGDVNGDSEPDIVVSLPGYRRQPDDVLLGAAYAFCGDGSDFGAEPCWKVYGSQPGSQFAASVAGAGDVDLDTFDDVIIGAPAYVNYLPPPDDTRPTGAAFVYFGSTDGLSTWSAWRARGDRSTTEFGASVGSAGFVRVGEPEGIIIGAPRYFISETAHGGAFAFYGPLEPSELEPGAFLPLVMINVD